MARPLGEQQNIPKHSLFLVANKVYICGQVYSDKKKNF